MGGPQETSAFPLVATTDEGAWAEFVTGLPVLALEAASVLVVAPHPDDETLACGGLLADLCSAGVRVTVVALTDGEGSHPDRRDLVDVRIAEQEVALGRLGVTKPAVRLGLADGHVAEVVDALGDRLADEARGMDLIVAPWRRDGHTDHDAAGHVAAEATRRLGIRLLEYPVWAWQWARPTDLAGRGFHRRPISADGHRRKLEAVGSFTSQTSDRFGAVILDEVALRRFQRRDEVYVDGR